MKAKIIGFKGNRRDTFNNSCILEVEDKNPPGLIGTKVFWKTATGRAIRGKIIRTHGKTALLARFRKGLPGFAIGDELVFKAPALP
ncbi:MAG: 50S ribosomal protein L35ae, partial [Candidatus Hydrothermarchaeaceae archaeon]